MNGGECVADPSASVWKTAQKWGEGWGRIDTSDVNHLLRPGSKWCFEGILSGVVFLQLNTVILSVQIMIYVRFYKLSAKIVSCSPPGNTFKSVFQQQNISAIYSDSETWSELLRESEDSVWVQVAQGCSPHWFLSTFGWLSFSQSLFYLFSDVLWFFGLVFVGFFCLFWGLFGVFCVCFCLGFSCYNCSEPTSASDVLRVTCVSFMKCYFEGLWILLVDGLYACVPWYTGCAGICSLL